MATRRGVVDLGSREPGAWPGVALAFALLLGVGTALPAGAATRRSVPGDAAPGWSCAPLDGAAAALRSAAQAAVARRWDDTRAQLATAEDRVRAVSETAPLRVATRLGPVDVELRDLQAQAASSNPVDARALRELASRVGRVHAACPAGRR